MIDEKTGKRRPVNVGEKSEKATRVDRVYDQAADAAEHFDGYDQSSQFMEIWRSDSDEESEQIPEKEVTDVWGNTVWR